MLSVSGARGIVGRTMTPPIARTFAAAFGSWVKVSSQQAMPLVCVGRDSRPSGEELAAALGCIGAWPRYIGRERNLGRAQRARVIAVALAGQRVFDLRAVDPADLERAQAHRTGDVAHELLVGIVAGICLQAVLSEGRRRNEQQRAADVAHGAVHLAGRVGKHSVGHEARSELLGLFLVVFALDTD
jgi:hypothetical protein